MSENVRMKDGYVTVLLPVGFGVVAMRCGGVADGSVDGKYAKIKN